MDSKDDESMRNHNKKERRKRALHTKIRVDSKKFEISFRCLVPQSKKGSQPIKTERDFEELNCQGER